MCVGKTLETEERILKTLDRQLLKIADKLDESFDPDDEASVKQLKLYRSMMTTRRMWAKEYNLVQVPEVVQVIEITEPEFTVERTTNGKAANGSALAQEADRNQSTLNMEGLNRKARRALRKKNRA